MSHPDPITLRLQPLTREAFEPFGQVLDYRPGDEKRRNFAAALFNDRTGARPNLRVQSTSPTALPFTARTIERHRRSSQMFAPISGGRYVVTVFPSDQAGDPVIAEGQAFLANGDQAINFNRDTWHHGFMAHGGEGVFLMLRWEDGGADDEEFRPLDRPIVLAD